MVSYDDMLNGAGAAPPYREVTASALPQAPNQGATDVSYTGASTSSSRSILFAWVALFALLVFAHVLTLPVQR